MDKAIVKNIDTDEEVVEFVNIIKQLDPVSFMLMQSNAKVLLARDKLEENQRTKNKTEKCKT